MQTDLTPKTVVPFCTGLYTQLTDVTTKKSIDYTMSIQKFDFINGVDNVNTEILKADVSSISPLL